MKQSDVRSNAFTDSLGTDWVAVDARGNPMCRAHDEATVRRTMPHAAAYMTTGRFVLPEGPAPEPDEHPARAPDALDELAAVGKTAVDADPVEPKDEQPPEPGSPPEPGQPVTGAAAFDRDGDGHVGGSLPKTRRKTKA